MRLLCRRARALRAEDGVSIVEVAVASFVLLVAIIGVMGSLGTGLSLVGQSRQESSGTAVAQERIERVRNIPYDRVALNQAPTHDPNPSHPDNAVSADGTTYRYDASQPAEPLVIDSGAGGMLHLDDPVTVGTVEFYVLQYVTWVDDPNITDEDNDPDRDYKRVVVVVTWKHPVHSPRSNRVTESTFVSDGKVVVSDTGPGGGAGSPSPAPSVTPPPFISELLGIGQLLFPAPPQNPNPNGPCPADAQGPTAEMSVLSGAGAELGYVRETLVQLRVNAQDTCEVTGNDPPNDITALLSNCESADPPPSSPTPTPNPLLPTPAPTPPPCSYTDVGKVESGVESTIGWSILPGDGRHRIYLQFVDANGLVSGIYGLDLILDQTKPSTPANMRKESINCPSNDRTVGMAWDASIDTNLVAYRVYKSLADSAYPKTEAGLTHSHTGPKKDIVSFTVRAYDKAGNASDPSNALNLAKNQCS